MNWFLITAGRHEAFVAVKETGGEYDRCGGKFSSFVTIGRLSQGLLLCVGDGGHETKRRRDVNGEIGALFMLLLCWISCSLIGINLSLKRFKHFTDKIEVGESIANVLVML